MSSLFNRFSKLRRKRAKFLNHLNFLQKCKYNNVIPKFIHLQCSVSNSNRVSKAITRAKFSVLRACIQDVRHKISKIEVELYDLHLSLGKNLVNFDSSENEDYISLSSFNLLLINVIWVKKNFDFVEKTKTIPKYQQASS